MHMRASHIAQPGVFTTQMRNRVVAMLIALLVLAAAVSIILVVSDDDASSPATVTPAQSAPTAGPNETARGRAAAGQPAFDTQSAGGPNEATRGNAAAGN